MFRIILQSINIGLSVASLVTSEVLQAKLNDLQSDLDDIRAELDRVDIDMKSGAEFFQKIVDVAHDLEWRTSEIDVFTNAKLEPLVKTILADSNKLFSEIAAIPIPEGTDPNIPSWQNAILWYTRVNTVINIIWSGVGLYDGLRTYFATKGQTPVPPPGNLKKTVVEIELDVVGISETRNLEIVTRPSATDVPALSEKEKSAARMEKIGQAFDAIFFVLNVVGLVLTIINYQTSSAGLNKAIDDTKAMVKKAKEYAKNLSEDEAKFFRDMPSTFLMIRSQLTQVLQIAAAAKLIKTYQTRDDKPLDEAITLANSYLPFNDADFKFMNDKVLELNKLETEKTGDELTKAITAVWKTVQEKIPSDRFATAFKKVPSLYAQLGIILKLSYDNFQFVNDMATAVRIVRNLVPKTHPTLQELGNILAPTLHLTTVPDSIPLAIIALYTDFTGNTYVATDDVKKIRDDNPTVDKKAWEKWVTEVTNHNAHA